jgi:hypothetical protein
MRTHARGCLGVFGAFSSTQRWVRWFRLGWLWPSCVAAGCPAPSGAPAMPIAGVTVDAPCVKQRCAEGLICRYAEPASRAAHRCVLAPGRCRDAWDCASSVQRCMRLGTRLGVCQDSGL